MILGDSQANRELFKDGMNVIFVKRGSSQDLKEKIMEQVAIWRGMKDE